MKKYLILLAGPPATGKSYLLEKIQTKYPSAFSLSPDQVKEMFAESHGFKNLNEKKILEKKVWQFYYCILEMYMQAGKRIMISEYPFSVKQKGRIEELINQYSYSVLTIRLEAEFNSLWERRKKRDRSLDRHLSHIMTHYEFGDQLSDRTEADNLIAKEEFKQIIIERGYNNFVLGKLFRIDVTDFSNVDYDELIDDISNIIE